LAIFTATFLPAAPFKYMSATGYLKGRQASLY
jgi:hypothetical protein